MIEQDKQPETSGQVGKCPVCGSDKVYIHRRGYSILTGLAMAVIFTLTFYIYKIISCGYSELNEAAKSGFIVGLTIQTFWPVLFGLLCGFIGSGRLRAKCLACGHKFTI